MFLKGLLAGKPHTPKPRLWQVLKDWDHRECYCDHKAVVFILWQLWSQCYLRRVFQNKQCHRTAGYSWPHQRRHLRWGTITQIQNISWTGSCKSHSISWLLAHYLLWHLAERGFSLEVWKLALTCTSRMHICFHSPVACVWSKKHPM